MEQPGLAHARAEALILDDLCKEFEGTEQEGVVAVNHVSLTIQPGEFVTVLGPSGCGKTTTLRMIAGFEKPSRGNVFLGARKLNAMPPDKREMAMVFQTFALWPHMTVYDNVAYGLRVRHTPAAVIKNSVEMVLHLMNLVGVEKRLPSQLSGGQQQRVALARALVMKPQVLLFDEPLSNLDAKLRVQMRGEIRRLQQRLGVTAVYVTHDQAEAMTLADRIVVMHQGRVEQVGTPAEIYQKPASVFVADFIGRANLLETRIESTHNGTARVTVFGRTLNVPYAGELRAGDEAYAILRPEAVQLSQTTGDARGEIRQATYLGSQVEYDVETGERTLTVIDHEPWAGHVFSEGTSIGITFHEASLHLLPRPNAHH